MKTQIIPAQITTVEDKIAANFSITQVIILLIPILFTTVTYALFPPIMLFVTYKLVLTLIVVIISLVSIIRVKGKIILQWAIIISRYNLRPKYYVYNKNSQFGRKIYKPTKYKKTKQKIKPQTLKPTEEPKLKHVLKLNTLLTTKKINLTYRANKKGGIDVAFEKIAK